MARKHNRSEVREVIGALMQAGVNPKETLRRLREGEAMVDKDGNPLKLDISLRTVHYHRKAFREEQARKMVPEPEATVHSIVAQENRIITLLAREITALEAKRPGSITETDIGRLNKWHQTATEIERRAIKYGRRKASGNGTAPGRDQKSESPVEQLAREEAERKTAPSVGVSAPGVQ